MKILSIAKALLLVALLPSALVAAEYRCADKIISVGDTGGELLMKCGEPDWKQSHAEEFIEAIDKDSKRKTIVTVDECRGGRPGEQGEVLCEGEIDVDNFR